MAFAFTAALEVLVGIRQTFVGLWYSFIRVITPSFVVRHHQLCESLRASGITERYSNKSVRSFKRHIVHCESDRFAFWARVVHPVSWFLSVATWAIAFVTACTMLYGLYLLCWKLLSAFPLIEGPAWQHIGFTWLAIVIGGVLAVSCFFATSGIVRLIGADPLRYTHYAWCRWKRVSVGHYRTYDIMPDLAFQAHEKVAERGGYTVVDEARKGEVTIDPFLYVSAIPIWMTYLPGLGWMRMCVAHWADDPQISRTWKQDFAEKQAL